jgi:hypothetical protein
MVEPTDVIRRQTFLPLDRRQILYLGFSWDQNFICIGTLSGYALYTKESQLIEYEGIHFLLFKDLWADLKEGIIFMDTTMSGHVIVLIGRGDTPQFSPNKAILWNRAIKKPFGNMEFPTSITKIVICENK